MRAQRLRLVAGTVALLITAPAFTSQAPDDVRAAFLRWASGSLYPISGSDLDASTRDLAPIDAMIGKATIVGLSEGQHGAAEPLIFRNRLFKHLVEQQGFSAIALESGIIEGRVLNDYVTQGKGEFDAVLKQGFSNGFDTFQQNRDLIHWIRGYNARLPRGAQSVQIFGLDIPGSPGNFDAARKPDTALRSALEYLDVVDPQTAAQLKLRVEPFLPVLEGINGYGALKQSGRDALTAAIADLVSLMERERHDYVARSSSDDFGWAERAAIGARQTDTWFRRMPLAWKLADGLEWTRHAMQVRDRAMADNLDWVRGRLDPHARVLVFAAVGHLASTEVRMPNAPFQQLVPLGTYLKDRFGSNFINILNLVANGEIRYCSANPQRVMPLKAPPETVVERLFAEIEVPRFLLDLRRAPSGVSSWLHQVHDHWTGFTAMQFATADAFDLVYFVSPISSACAPHAEPGQ